MLSFTYHPVITFEDTNIVGNVYFANLVRWQNECRNEWIRTTEPDIYKRVFQNSNRIVVSDASLRFLDPIGASLGDVVDVQMSISPTGENVAAGEQSYHATFQIHRRPSAHSVSPAEILATGQQRFVIVDSGHEAASFRCNNPEIPFGPAYILDAPVSLDACRKECCPDMLELVRWQGKCRERFLTEYAPLTVNAILDGSLALHTSQVQLQLLHDRRVACTDTIRIEMRLTKLKGGRLTMQFDYFIVDGASREAENPTQPAHCYIATGMQSLCCKRVGEHGMTPAVFPVDMLGGLLNFAGSSELQGNIADALKFAEESGLVNDGLVRIR